MPQPEQRFIGVGTLPTGAGDIIELVPAQPRDIEVTEIAIQGINLPAVVLTIIIRRGGNAYSPPWLLGNGAIVDAGFFLTSGTNIEVQASGGAGSDFAWQIRYRTLSNCPDEPPADPAIRRTFVQAIGGAVS